MAKHIIVFFALFCFTVSAFSQGEIIQQKDLNFYNENSWGFRLNSDGYGLDYRFEYRYSNKLRGLLETGLFYLKDPKEIKLYNPFFPNQRKFVYGKVNFVTAVKAGTGIQKEIFSKQDKNSIAIRYQLIIGITAAIAKPIYYSIVDSTIIVGNQQLFFDSPQQFNLDFHNPSDIISRESFFMGFSETKIIPGLFARTGFNFEFSNDLYRTSALEIGTEIDFFLKDVTIMAENGKIFFTRIYFSYRFGNKYSTLISRDARKFLRKEQKQNM
jgi:hypothetical protein